MINMEFKINIFHQTFNKIADESMFDNIVQKQQQIFDIHVYKIDFSQLQNIFKIYKRLTIKYHITKELQIAPDSWNQNQKRLFVWFLLFYTYFLQQDNLNITEQLWIQFSDIFFGKEPYFLEFQYFNLMKNKGKLAWTAEEDKILTECVKSEQMGKWNEVSKKMFFITDKEFFRSPKHCRERWLNHLDNNKKHGEWTPTQDYTIFTFVQENGKKWSKIVHLLNQSRTQHMIKNRYNSVVSKYSNNKKIKQEEIVTNICNNLEKIIESATSESKSHDNIIDDSSLNKKCQHTPEMNEMSDVIPEVPEINNYPTLEYIPQEYPFAFVLDYNTMCYLNSICYMTPSLPQNFVEKTINPSEIFSPKTSNFTVYKSQ